MSKKKAKEGKKAMTEEEKALNLQAQEDVDRKKEQTVTQFLKDKVEEDESSSVLRMRKLNEGWRILSRVSENEGQRRQIDELKQSMERKLGGIDDCIQNMTEELREKEQHSAQVHQHHLMHISQLNELQKKRTGLLQQERESAMTRINQCYRLKREQMSFEDTFQSLNLEANVSDIQDHYEELLRDTASTCSSIMDLHDRSVQENEIKQRTKSLKKLQLDLHIKTLQLQEVTDENQKCRDRLISRRKEMENDEKKIAALKSEDLLQEINDSKVEAQLVDSAKTNQTLKAKVERSRARSRKRLTKLTVQSDKAERRVKSVIAQGEEVLRMAALCQKKEDRLNMTEDLLENCEEDQQADDIAEQEKCDFPELGLLARRRSKAIAQRDALRRQRDRLYCQNKQLQHQKKEMQSSHHNMEIRGGCKPQNTPLNTASSKGEGKHAAASKRGTQKKAS